MLDNGTSTMCIHISCECAAVHIFALVYIVCVSSHVCTYVSSGWLQLITELFTHTRLGWLGLWCCGLLNSMMVPIHASFPSRMCVYGCPCLHAACGSSRSIILCTAAPPHCLAAPLPPPSPWPVLSLIMWCPLAAHMLQAHGTLSYPVLMTDVSGAMQLWWYPQGKHV